MSDFYRQLYELATKTSPQAATDLGILSGFLSATDPSAYAETQKAARASLLRIAALLVTDDSANGDAPDQIDLDDAMDAEEDAAAANGQIL